MDELWDIVHEGKPPSQVFLKPHFPTSRWGNVYTKTSTNDYVFIQLALKELQRKGVESKKIIDKTTSDRHRRRGTKFYSIKVLKK